MSDKENEVKKGWFVELKYTGYVNGTVFDSNIEKDLKTIEPEGKPKKTIVCVGEGMVVKGLDRELEGKEVGKEMRVTINSNDAFGERKRELIRVIPMRVFAEKKINPRQGGVYVFDNSVARVIAISGGRVTTDFNNPLAGKEVEYKFIVERKVDELKEKAEALFEFYLRFVPDFEIGEKIVVKGQKGFEVFVNSVNDKFKKLLGKDLEFKEEVKKEGEKKGNEEDKTKGI